MKVLLFEAAGASDGVLAQGLRALGYSIHVARDGRLARELSAQLAPVAVLFESPLPNLEVDALLAGLAGRTGAPPVLLCGRCDPLDRVRALERGADDVLEPPVSVDELGARLRSVIRRRYGRAENRLVVADLELDVASGEVHRGGQRIELSPREFAILEHLMLRPGQIISRDELINHAYEADERPRSNALDVSIAKLRRKIDRAFGRKLIHTRNAMGYFIAPPRMGAS